MSKSANYLFHTTAVVAILLLGALSPAAAQSSRTAADSSATSTTTVDDAAFNAYLRVTKDMKPPRPTKSPDPEYPKIPIDTEPNGIVVMLIGIAANGHVELVHVLRASNPAFEASAVSTVKTWKFSPAKKDGQTVPVQITVEMKFQK